jgi:hypothetical protein
MNFKFTTEDDRGLRRAVRERPRQPGASTYVRRVKGDGQVLELLNEVLTAERTAINQYFVDGRMLQHWGYPTLASK